MERLEGFKFEDVAGMKDAGVDTEAVVRTGMIGFMEGAMIHGIFHGDLHGGNLFVLPDGRTALLDFGIVGRLSEAQAARVPGAARRRVEQRRRRASSPPCATSARCRPTSTSTPMIDELGLDRPLVDPTTMTGDELVAEIQRTVKALLGYGARMPKELMLFVKNMVFLDGAIATLAPDLDIFAEIAHHLDRTSPRSTASGSWPSSASSSTPTGSPTSPASRPASASTTRVESLTYRELQDRRSKIRENLAGPHRPGRRTRWRPADRPAPPGSASCDRRTSAPPPSVRSG